MYDFEASLTHSWWCGELELKVNSTDGWRVGDAFTKRGEVRPTHDMNIRQKVKLVYTLTVTVVEDKDNA